MFRRVMRLGLALALVVGQTAPLYASASPVSTKPADNVVIHRVQAGGATTGTTNHEYIEIYNNTDTDIEVTGWCLVYNNSRTPTACLEPPDASTAIFLTAHTSVLFMNPALETLLKESDPEFAADVLFTNLANIATTSGSLRLVDDTGTTIDLLGWGTGLAEGTAAPGNMRHGMILQRKSLINTAILQDTGNNLADFEIVKTPGSFDGGGLYELFVPVDACLNTPEFDSVVPVGYMQDENGDCHLDVCDNLAGLQKTVPQGYRADGVNCALIPLIITELLPNVAGSDTGKEFVEFYNPNDEPVELDNYYLRLGNETKRYVLPTDLIIQPLLYLVLSDTQLGLTLPNSSSWLSLFAPDGTLLNQTDVYNSPAEDESWALVDGGWQYTNRPTPSQPNLASTPESDTNEPEPCPEGKFRNPETNRCKNLIDTLSGLLPCQPGYERNPETNRCRRIRVDAGLEPCKPGYERNPETNRCRRIRVDAGLAPCKPGYERNPETNRCRRIQPAAGVAGTASYASAGPSELHNGLLASVAFMALAYGGWEYRLDLANWLARFRSKFK